MENTVRNWLSLGLFLMSFFLFGCSSEKEIKVYRLAKGKELNSPDLASGEHEQENLPIPRVASAGISWQIPSSWEEKPAGGMRKGSFSARGGVDISAIFLEGNVGGDLANVNRWRQQINLSPWSANDFSEAVVNVRTELGEGQLVDFATGEFSGDRIVAVLVPYKHGIWFFKMTGDYRSVEAQTDAFQEYLHSIHR